MSSNMTKEEFQAAWPYLGPTMSNTNDVLRGGVEKHDEHYAVKIGARHYHIGFMPVCHSKGLEKVDGHDWELFRASHKGERDGKQYLWGMFVEGIGAFHVMFPSEYVRDLLPHERDAWSKKTLGMYGSHSGELSYTLPSGVRRTAKAEGRP